MKKRECTTWRRTLLLYVKSLDRRNNRFSRVPTRPAFLLIKGLTPKDSYLAFYRNVKLKKDLGPSWVPITVDFTLGVTLYFVVLGIA